MAQEMWDEAEQSITDHPRLRDIYRELRKQRSSRDPWAYSHITSGGPKRYDHIYVGPGLEPTSCRYWTRWLEDELSDHGRRRSRPRPERS